MSDHASEASVDRDEYPYGCWPIILTKERVAEFDRFVKLLRTLVSKVLREYFDAAVAAFASYLNVSPFLHQMLATVEVEQRDERISEKVPGRSMQQQIPRAADEQE